MTVSFVCSDDLSGVAACPADHVVSSEGEGQTLSRTAADVAGNTASTTVSGIDIDLTAPAVMYTGNASVYDVDDDIDISCMATDELSGVATSTCAGVSAPAFDLAVGTTRLSAVATDRAGNLGFGSTTFEVVVTADGLSGVVEALVRDRGLRTALLSELDAGAIQAFINQVQAQAGKSISRADAEDLIRFARTLL